ncbi:MAG: glycine zipper 2TM domain-containing protein [Betaproteobacteria bacterium]|nr:glycine zipper 2TM domain-containing protein [Betaproteobacteria bacterium]
MKKMIWISLLTLLLGSTGVYARCDNCGVVTEVKTVKQKGEGSGVGAVAGGVLGGVLGHQVGGGRGKDLATIAGAAGGAYAGHQAEKKIKEKTVYQVIVKMENGQTRTFTYENEPGFRSEDKVKVVNGKLTRV